MKLNEAQQFAVDCNDKRIVCLSGAGTGKSTTMIQRVCRLIDDGVDPTSILALTFTNVAAFEMREKFKKQKPGCIFPEFRTFHSFCYHLLSRDQEVREALGYSKVPAIAQNQTANRINATAALQMKVTLSKAKLQGSVPLTPKEQYEYEKYIRASKRLLYSENLITFDVLCYDTSALFIDNHPSVDKYKQKYKYILVDESQDTDEKQWKFVMSFKDAGIFIVGDALQSIYSFRGARSDLIKGIASDKAWTSIKLTENYRSTEEICDFANSMSDYADPSYRVLINGHGHSDAPRVWKSEAIPNMEPLDMKCVSRIIDDLEDKLDGRTIAILCRTNNEVDEVVAQLRDANIECSTVKNTSECEEIINSALDINYCCDWLSSYLKSELYSEYLRQREIRHDEKPISVLLDLYEHLPQIAYRKSTVAAVQKIALDKDMLPGQKLIKLCELLEILIPEIDITGMTAREVLEALKDANSNPTSSCVYVGTVHSVKGLEYDDVYLVGVNDITWKLKTEENKNLYYVGITRAKKNLTVCYRRENPYDSQSFNRKAAQMYR